MAMKVMFRKPHPLYLQAELSLSLHQLEETIAKYSKRVVEDARVLSGMRGMKLAAKGVKKGEEIRDQIAETARERSIIIVAGGGQAVLVILGAVVAVMREDAREAIVAERDTMKIGGRGNIGVMRGKKGGT